MADKSSIEWRPVPTHAGYFACREGHLLGPRGRELRPMVTNTGHLYVLTPSPRRPRKLFVHRAVLLAFVGPPAVEGLEARHLDGDPRNNDLSNLAWGTRSDNAQDRIRHGRSGRGEASPMAVLNLDVAAQIRSAPGSARAVGGRFGVSHTTVLKIRRGERWVA